MEQQLVTGFFPASKPSTNGVAKNGGSSGGFIETEVKLANWWEVGRIYMVLGIFGLGAHWIVRCWGLVVKALGG